MTQTKNLKSSMVGYFLCVLTVLLSLSFLSVSYAAEIFVDGNLSGNCTSGNYSKANRNCSGRDGIAYNTIQGAVNVVKPGDTITIRGGVYSKSVWISKQGTSTAWITIRAYPGEAVRVDGGKSLPSSWIGLVHLQNCQYIRIQGIKIYNSKYYGFQATNSHNVILEKCEVAYSNHGGVIFNGGSRITVSQCDVHHTNAVSGAAHEAVTLEGVDTFEVVGCTVHDNREEGIDAKYGSKNGRIHHNRSYRNNGPNIYIDSASYIDVYNNAVYGANKSGIGIAVEYVWNKNRHTTSNLKVYNNLSYDNGAGIWIWAEPGSESFARFSNISIVNNTIHGNNRANWGGIFVDSTLSSSFGSNLVVRNNILCDNTALSGARNIRGTSAVLGKFIIDRNLFKQGQPSNTTGYSAVTTSDVRFVDAVNRNYRLRSDSPAVNAGSTALAPTVDFDGAARSDGKPDIGTYEYKGTSIQTGTSSSTWTLQ